MTKAQREQIVEPRPGGVNRWFPDDPLNGQDRMFTVLPPGARQKLTCKIEAPTGPLEPDSKIAVFSIVVPNG